MFKRIILLLLSFVFLMPMTYSSTKNNGIQEEVSNETPFSEKAVNLYGGVAPHHDIAYPLIEEFYNQMQEFESIEQIILIGPNHQGLGYRFQITTGNAVAGQKESREELRIIEDFLSEEVFKKADLAIAQKEHSITVHLDFLNRTFKNVPIIALMCTESHDLENLKEVIYKIKEISGNKQTLVIGSVDFSHYLTQEEAQVYDAITWKTILEGDIAKLMTYDSKYLDAPTVVAIVAGVFENKPPILINHGNSQDYFRRFIYETTSYFTYRY